MKHRHPFWAANAIILGAWEATAVGTQRVPTITTTARSVGRYRLGKLVVLVWCLALARHLTGADEHRPE